MPKPSFPAAAEGVPAISRRRLLTASAAIVAAAGAPITAGAIVAPHDPMADLLQRYNDQLDFYNATTGLTEEESDRLGASTWGQTEDLILDAEPAVTSMNGVARCIRTVLRDECAGGGGNLEQLLLRQALAYIEGIVA